MSELAPPGDDRCIEPEVRAEGARSLFWAWRSKGTKRVSISLFTTTVSHLTSKMWTRTRAGMLRICVFIVILSRYEDNLVKKGESSLTAVDVVVWSKTSKKHELRG